MEISVESGMETKVCSKCGVEKGLEEFYTFVRKDRGNAIRYSSKCKDCDRAASRERQRNKPKPPKKPKKPLKNERELTVKTCRTCEIEKPVECFAKTKKDDGRILYRNQCKECAAKYHVSYYQDNKEEFAAKGKEYYEENRGQLVALNRAYRQECKDGLRPNTQLDGLKSVHKNSEVGTCEKCGVMKELNAFLETHGGRTYYSGTCIDCRKAAQQVRGARHYELNTEKVQTQSRQYYKDNKDWVTARNKEYVGNHKEEIRKYKRMKYRTDPAYRLHSIVSGSINKMLKANGSSKRGASINAKLTRPIAEMKKWLESKFEPRMTWKNHGVYDPETYDTNPTWQIDHIIPQSDLPYTSMDDENFKKCWSLENLRPMWSKQNLMDGVTRVRHTTPRKSKKRKKAENAM